MREREEDWGLRDELAPIVQRVLDANEGEPPHVIRKELKKARPKAVLGSKWAHSCWLREIDQQQKRRKRGYNKPKKNRAKGPKVDDRQLEMFPKC